MDSVSRKPEDLLKLADLHPEIAQWLQNNSPPPQNLQDINSLRAMYEKINQRYLESFGADTATGVTVEDRTVTARDGYEIPIRTYRPASSTEAGPLIIALHGGAKVMGSLTDEEGHCRIFAKEFNACCVNIGYRLAPQHKSPIMAYDCWDVIQWAAKHAGEMNADPTKGFIVQGSSSGGNLADIMGHLSRDEKLEPPITGLLEICTSPCQYDAMPEQYKSEFLSWDQEFKGGLPREGLLRFFELTGAAENPSDHFNSPLLWPRGHKRLAPVFFQIHGRDYVRDAGLIYERVLREEGVETKLKVYPGVPHGFNTLFPTLNVAKQHEKDTLDGLRWLLSLAKRE